MGSLKDEKRALEEDHESCEKTDDGLPIKSINCSTEPEGSHLSSSHDTPTQDDNLIEPSTNVCITEKTDGKTTSDKQVASEADLAEKQSAFMHERVKTQGEGEKTTTPSSVEAKISIIAENREDQVKDHEDKTMDHNKQNNKDLENILPPVPMTPDHTDPRSPAPFGQQHMRTQVSLEVVQCCSAATSPMTPPEGGHPFFFPNSFGKNVDLRADAKDAELQVGQVEFCSVATSPMTPRSPSTTAFPELIGQETVQKDGSHKNNSVPEAAESEISGVSASTKSKEINPKDSQEIRSKVLPPTTPDSPAAPEKSQQNTQLRMGSMDQDITILVTHYVNNEAEEHSDSLPPSDEEKEEVETSSTVKRLEEKEMISTDFPSHSQNSSDSNSQFVKTKETSPLESHPQKVQDQAEHSDVKEATDDQRDTSVTKSVPESPAPFGCQNIRTQVSLEVVQCQSVATSPMTPPEGGQAFYFPNSVGQSVTLATETKDAELQVGQQVEFRSVATAPMTPRTPVATIFPDIRKEASVEEKIIEEEENEDGKEDTSVKEDEPSENKEEDLVKEEKQETETDEEKCEEPVQEVNWDEKGMTWEVYGAVVEVAVLGSAIQKHLEKQVKKQKMHATLPPPPPLNPSAMPLTAEALQGGSGSGKGRAGKRGKQDAKVGRRRRNPFRQLMENMHQPHCCSKAHTTE